jgi:hypothetical protein
VLSLAYLGREIWLWLKAKLGIGETAEQTTPTATHTGDTAADASETATGHQQAADNAPNIAIPAARVGALTAVWKILSPVVAAAQETGARMGNVIEGWIPTNVIGTLDSYTRGLFLL